MVPLRVGLLTKSIMLHCPVALKGNLAGQHKTARSRKGKRKRLPTDDNKADQW